MWGVPAKPVVSITPEAGATQIRPDTPIVVRVGRGRLDKVEAGVDGVYSADRTVWRSAALHEGRTYTVTARATGAGETVAVSRFSTLKVVKILKITEITPKAGERVGVGMPIIVTFNRRVRERAAVTRALWVDTEQVGAWRWVAPNRVVFRTRDHWRPLQRVTLRARLAWTRSAPGTYGVADRTRSFTVDRALTSTISTRSHVMTVRRNGKIIRRIRISAGNGATPGTTTTTGVHLAMAKTDPERMISPGRRPGDPGYYDMRVSSAVRISDSGEFVHAAPWSVSAQGNRNVSHGCVNVSPADARWFYRRTLRGDIITITGTKRILDWRNGWGFWQVPWSVWTGRTGSRPTR
ncbi:Ig-like domain-containing protein [Actinocorallia longicatena]|uniref:Ig-like domain-containing protein n=1 Tax=Actinocorallia longicatena TaxID=111803 RepID=A0ABP6QI78_9ACTN